VCGAESEDGTARVPLVDARNPRSDCVLQRGKLNNKPVTDLPWHFGETIHTAHFPRHDRTRWSVVQCGCSHVNGIAGDDRLDNLRWLCRGCHLAADRKQHYETRAARKDAARPLLAEATA